MKYPRGYFLTHRGLDTVTEIYETMLKNMEETDFCVFEASFPSTVNVGHEISVALDRGKPTIVLFASGCEPILIRGIKGSKIIWIEYNEKNLVDELNEAICVAKENLNIRFNFFITPQLLTFLNKISKEKGVPRSVYIRHLIDEDMKKNGGFVKGEEE